MELSEKESCGSRVRSGSQSLSSGSVLTYGTTRNFLTWQALLGVGGASAEATDAHCPARRSRRALQLGPCSALEVASQNSASRCKRPLRPSTAHRVPSSSLQICVCSCTVPAGTYTDKAPTASHTTW